MRRSAANSDAKRINEYANSMFRHERLHDEWIGRCTRYVQAVFGARISGATVIDYGFGRGNWSVAFARAGAERIVAIDASAGNVKRFSAYCHRAGLANIEVRLGNVLAEPVGAQADLLWVYGVFHHIRPAARFARALAGMLQPDGEMLLYAYNRDCLRRVVVEAARKAIACPTEAAFRRIAGLFTPGARLRARDDLTAPYIRWYNSDELLRLFEPPGLFYSRSVESFRGFLGGADTDPEFAPHHLVLSRTRARGGAAGARGGAADRPDLSILRAMAGTLFGAGRAAAPRGRDLAVGLINTHFSALEKPAGAARSAFEDFLFLLHALIASGVDVTRLSGAARQACRWALRKAEHGAVAIPESSRRESAILQLLESETVRL